MSSDTAPAFDVDVACTLGNVRIAARFTAGSGITVLHGPSGAGKTSVLNMIAGLLRPQGGHIRVAGVPLFDANARIDIAPHHRRIGYVFQDLRLFPHMRVRANLLYGAQNDGQWIDFDEAVRFLDIADLLDRWPRSLSGGEAQRVAIGRAMLSGARTLLMDEPMSSLDPSRREDALRVIERVRDALDLPILYVTHDAAEADRLASRKVTITRD
ncbi:MAG: molybdenum ABC transporter ATP-binding protein [Sphingobium sp.]|jgi:molybdate transport system ATP-binding protein|nr:MAG: molybdenum ABC transporter ATP-binding protein [Sphingobium sp.]